MSRLFKFALLTLISLTSLNAFQFQNPDSRRVLFLDLKYLPNIKSIDATLINSEYFRFNNNIYRIETMWSYFIRIPSSLNTFSSDNNYFYYRNNQQKIAYCEGSNDYDFRRSEYHRNCFTKPDTVRNQVDYFDFVKFTARKITTCQPNEHFNTNTQQCQSCPEGHSWDKENNKCYPDCSDVNKNKWGWTDGTCTDCSKETTDDGVSQCYCKGIGSSYKTSHVTVCPDGGSICITSCDDGSQFNFKKPNTPDIPKPDPNAPDTPGGPGNQNPNNPGGGNGGPGGDNGGSGGNQGGGNSGGGSGGQDNQGGDTGGSGGNNNGNNQGGGNSGGGSGGSGSGSGKDKDAKFNPDDFKYGDIEDMYKDLKGKLQNSVKENEGKFKDLEKGINQLIDNIKGNGLSSFDKQSAPTSCKRSFVVPIYGKSVSFDVDLCKLLEPMRPVVYYVVYVSAFAGGLFLVIKLIIFSF